MLGTWSGLTDGAGVFGYGHTIAFQRIVARRNVFGAQKKDNHWHSHPLGMAGTIDCYKNTILPKTTVQAGVVIPSSELGTFWASPFKETVYPMGPGSITLRPYHTYGFPRLEMQVTRPVFVQIVLQS